MQVLVVHAHPSPDSFNHALFEKVVGALVGAGHLVDSIDLYDEKFDPRMTRAERLAYQGPNPIISSEVERYAEAVGRAQALVFVYPTWWFGLPAILKGWLERVMVPGVAFVFEADTNKVVPNLQAVRRIIGVTTYGSSWWYTKFFTDGGRRTLVRALRLICNRSTRSKWLGLYGLDSSTPKQREAFSRKVGRVMADL